MNFTKKQRKAISKVLKRYNIPQKKEVFDAINNGWERDKIFDMIRIYKQWVDDNRKPVIEPLPAMREFNVFGKSIIANNAMQDMRTVMSMPFNIRGALLPDAHRIAKGQVTVGASVLSKGVVPAYVGSDIACSVLLSIFDVHVDDKWFHAYLDALKWILENRTYFGYQLNESKAFADEVAQLPDITDNLVSPPGKQVWQSVRGMAATQFGTCGDGNHFVEIGSTDVEIYGEGNMMRRSSRRKLAIMSHFGSRGIGARIAKAFQNFAQEQYEMPKGIIGAPLYLDTPEGQDYWTLMQWAGEFAKRGHKWLHRWLIQNIDETISMPSTHAETIYSRHNFAWETSEGILHRKGATPASFGDFGIIPATMGDESKIVVGLGNEDALNSASHGAGRIFSRGDAMRAYGKDDTVEYLLKNHGVHLIGGGADEDPRAYKRIDEVMEYQKECVDVIGGFMPKVVRMAPPRIPHWKKKKRK